MEKMELIWMYLLIVFDKLSSDIVTESLYMHLMLIIEELKSIFFFPLQSLDMKQRA